MKQQTLAQGSFELYRKPTKREKFLNDMEQVIPWQALHDLLVPYNRRQAMADRRSG